MRVLTCNCHEDGVPDRPGSCDSRPKKEQYDDDDDDDDGHDHDHDTNPPKQTYTPNDTTPQSNHTTPHGGRGEPTMGAGDGGALPHRDQI